MGTLDEPDNLPPDVHIFTESKQPWVVLPKDDIAVDVFYDYEKVWSPKNFERRNELLAMVKD